VFTSPCGAPPRGLLRDIFPLKRQVKPAFLNFRSTSHNVRERFFFRIPINAIFTRLIFFESD